MTLSFLFTRNVHTLLRVPSKNKPDSRPKWVKSIPIFQTERAQKPYPLWWLRAAWGGSTSGGLPSWKVALNVSGQKVVYSDFVYNVWCLQPCINKGDDNDNGFWYSDQGHSSLPHPLPQLRWAHQCLTCMLVPVLVVRLKKKLEIFVSCKCLVT